MRGRIPVRGAGVAHVDCDAARPAGRAARAARGIGHPCPLASRPRRVPGGYGTAAWRPLNIASASRTLPGVDRREIAVASQEPAPRSIDRWFASYSGDHRNATNQAIHVFAVPAILWSVIALLWAIPAPGTLFKPGIWAVVAMFPAWLFYYRASRRLGLGMLALFAALALLTGWLHGMLGAAGLAWLALAVFVVAWIAQFVGHRIEGRKPSFLTDLVYLLIGPAWVLAKLYRRLGWTY